MSLKAPGPRGPEQTTSVAPATTAGTGSGGQRVSGTKGGTEVLPGQSTEDIPPEEMLNTHAGGGPVTVGFVPKNIVLALA